MPAFLHLRQPFFFNFMVIYRYKDKSQHKIPLTPSYILLSFLMDRHRCRTNDPCPCTFKSALELYCSVFDRERIDMQSPQLLF